MLTPSMTYKEMVDHLASDREKLQIKKDILRPKAIRELKKEKKFPAWRCYEYTVPATKNQYVIFFYAASRAFVEKPFVDSFCRYGKFAIKWGSRPYQHTENSPMSFVRQLSAYPPHFFKRYNERIIKDETLNYNDIVCLYFSRNRKEMPININEDISRKISEYGEIAERGFRVDDGFCFTHSVVEGDISEDGDMSKDKVDALVFVYTTFMNESGMEDSQIKAINEEHKKGLEYFFKKYDEVVHLFNK